MNARLAITTIVLLLMSLVSTGSCIAIEAESALQKSMSDTLDVWREGRYEQLFEQLAHRGKTSRESFVKKMHDSTTHPACCWQKMENFKILNEKSNDATVYVKIGLEGSPGSATSVTREFKLTQQDGLWKMQLADVLLIAGVSGKKGGNKKSHAKKSSPYHN
ncbi:MAG: hypothetical protein WCI45_04760 [Desulfuromonadales bacterium]